MTAAQAPLRCAVVTRPRAQALPWVDQLRAQGVPAHALPLIEIAGAPDSAALLRWWAARVLAPLSGEKTRLVMFVSPGAVHGLVDALAGDWAWPDGVRAAGTGPGTASALRAAGVPAESIVAPGGESSQFDSEALWALLQPAAAWRGCRVAIVRGDGGREWLGDQFRAAGAAVDVVQSYVRKVPAWSDGERGVLAAAQAQPSRHAWVFSSSQSIDHLAALAPEAVWSSALALASHPRIAQAARNLGFGCVDTVRPTVEAVVRALQQHAPRAH